MKKSIHNPSIIIATLLMLLIPSICVSAQEIARDRHFVAYENGVVKDTRTGLEWVAGPDRNMTWSQARDWVQSLSIAGGGWRMPTTDELKTLYEKGKGNNNRSPLLKKHTVGNFVWSRETKDSSSAWGFFFGWGRRMSNGRDKSRFSVAFAVRSR